MLKYFQKPAKIFFGASLFILLLTLYFFKFVPHTAIDIAMHDTYFIISRHHIYGCFTIVYGILGGIYWLLRNVKLFLSLNILHVSLSILFFIYVFYGLAQLMPNTSDQDYSFNTFTAVSGIMDIFILWAGIFVVVQFLFVLNILISLFRKER